MQPATEDWLYIIRGKIIHCALMDNKEERRVYGKKLLRKLAKCIVCMEEFILMPGEEETKKFYAYTIEVFTRIGNNIYKTLVNKLWKI